jgi:hypothetical protein
MVVCGLAPLSISAWRIHLDDVIGQAPRSLAICSIGAPSSQVRATFEGLRATLAETA